jgi:hypothetical protein
VAPQQVELLELVDCLADVESTSTAKVARSHSSTRLSSSDATGGEFATCRKW